MDKNFWKEYHDELSYIAPNFNSAWVLIDNITSEKYRKENMLNTVSYVEYYILCYIYVWKMLGEKLSYDTVEGFFCDCNPDGKEEYEKFLSFRKPDEISDFGNDRLRFLLKHIEGDICRDIAEVLNDSDDDPHCSAVAITNYIKCYIKIMNGLGKALSFSNVFEFFITHGYSQKQYLDFEESRRKESVYYRGIQY